MVLYEYQHSAGLHSLPLHLSSFISIYSQINLWINQEIKGYLLFNTPISLLLISILLQWPAYSLMKLVFNPHHFD